MNALKLLGTVFGLLALAVPILLALRANRKPLPPVMLALLLLAGVTVAGPVVTLTWDNPTNCVDGSPCGLTDSNRVGVTTALAYTNWIVVATNIADVALMAGTNAIRVTAFVSGVESAWSDAWSTNYVPVPNPPTKPRKK